MTQKPSAPALVRSVCDVAARLAAGTPCAATVTTIRSRLDGPLRVAIAGRVKAGKSTLLNALIGERLAPTDAGECTRVVTAYREAAGYEVRAYRTDGTIEDLRFERDSGALHIDLEGRSADGIDWIEVGWPSSALRVTTLVDTPGLGSINAGASRRTEEFFETENDPRNADAVIYLMRHLHRGDVDFLETFGDHSLADPSPINAVAVLSRADEIGAARLDALLSAARIAARYRSLDELRRTCATVLPVAGLLAETGLTLQEDEVASLRALAALEQAELDELLLSADRFRAAGVSPVGPGVRADLLSRLGMFGVRFSIEALRSGRVVSASDLARELVSASGLPDLRRILAEHFARRADLLKARSALRALRVVAHELASYDAARSEQLAAEVERVEAASHEFAHLRLLYLVLSDQVSLSETEIAEVNTIIGAGSAVERLTRTPAAEPSTPATVALGAVDRWRRKGAHPRADVATREACETVARTYEALYVELTSS